MENAGRFQRGFIPWNKGKARVPDCHPEQPHRAHGLCRSCYHSRYSSQRYKKNKEYFHAYYKADRKKNPDRWYVYHVASFYGISPEAYRALFEKQGGLCAICNKKPHGKTKKARRLHLDHDHSTGKVRGLLCLKCNMVLGGVQDNPEILLRAVLYLKGQCDA